jgi:hypothetical protein
LEFDYPSPWKLNSVWNRTTVYREVLGQRLIAKFLNEPLKQFQRQPASTVGRADLIFQDRIGRLLVIELKRDTLERRVISQLVVCYGMLKSRCLRPISSDLTVDDRAGT